MIEASPLQGDVARARSKAEAGSAPSEAGAAPRLKERIIVPDQVLPDACLVEPPSVLAGCVLLAAENAGLRRIEVSGMIDTKKKRPAPNDRSA
jgi:hypothetical protein